MRKGDINLIFIIIVGILVVGLIVIFGLRMASSLRIRAEQSEQATLVANFQSDLSHPAGWRAVRSYNFPDSPGEACIVDLATVDPDDIMDEIVHAHVASGAAENLFLIEDGNIEAYTLPHLSLPDYPHYSCVRGLTTITFESRGGKTSLSIISRKYCENAQDGSFCDFLDAIFGNGYRTGCCREYGQCC